MVTVWSCWHSFVAIQTNKAVGVWSYHTIDLWERVCSLSKCTIRRHRLGAFRNMRQLSVCTVTISRQYFTIIETSSIFFSLPPLICVGYLYRSGANEHKRTVAIIVTFIAARNQYSTDITIFSLYEKFSYHHIVQCAWNSWHKVSELRYILIITNWNCIEKEAGSGIVHFFFILPTLCTGWRHSGNLPIFEEMEWRDHLFGYLKISWWSERGN